MARKKKRAKVVKARVLKVQKLAEDRHVIATEFEVHGPGDALPDFSEPVEIVPEAMPDQPAPAKHWYDFLTDW